MYKISAISEDFPTLAFNKIYKIYPVLIFFFDAYL
jgi:hypothetical protein